MAEANNSPRLSSKSWIEDISGDNAALSLLVSAINEILAEEIINMTPEEVAAGMHLRLFSQEPPMQVKPQSPFEAYHALMSGTIANIFDDLMFVPDFTRESQVRLKFDFLMSTVNDIETPEDLNTAKHFLKNTQTSAPRFLFRGFNTRSGGGIDPKLNSPEAVIPHAFLDGGEMPTDMWNIQDLYKMIKGHLGFNRSISSAFSSWTHYMGTAEYFAESMKESRIAVLDTRSFRQNVYFSNDLWRAALCEIPYMNEFLIFGPVTGPDYYTVSVGDLYQNTQLFELQDADSDEFGEVRISSVERGAVEASKEIATFLQPPGTSLQNILILTARFVGVRVAILRPGQQYLSPDDMRGFLHYIRDDLQELAMQKGATRISLVEPNMDTSFCRDLVFEVQLQQAAQNAVHALCWERRAAIFKSSGIKASVMEPDEEDDDTDFDVADEMELDAADSMDEDVVGDMDLDVSDVTEIDVDDMGRLSDVTEIDVADEMMEDIAEDTQPDEADEMEL